MHNYVYNKKKQINPNLPCYKPAYLSGRPNNDPL